jgi:hypothetical protein
MWNKCKHRFLRQKNSISAYKHSLKSCRSHMMNKSTIENGKTTHFISKTFKTNSKSLKSYMKK